GRWTAGTRCSWSPPTPPPPPSRPSPIGCARPINRPQRAPRSAPGRAVDAERQPTMDTVLVTGGAGFIGSNFVRMLLRRQAARVVVLDKLTYAGNLQSLADVRADPRLPVVDGGIVGTGTVAGVCLQHPP